MPFLRIFFTPKLGIPSIVPFPSPAAPYVFIIRKFKSSLLNEVPRVPKYLECPSAWVP